jgi:hypothetical protein
MSSPFAPPDSDDNVVRIVSGDVDSNTINAVNKPPGQLKRIISRLPKGPNKAQSPPPPQPPSPEDQYQISVHTSDGSPDNSPTRGGYVSVDFADHLAQQQGQTKNGFFPPSAPQLVPVRPPAVVLQPVIAQRANIISPLSPTSLDRIQSHLPVIPTLMSKDASSDGPRRIQPLAEVAFVPPRTHPSSPPITTLGSIADSPRSDTPRTNPTHNVVDTTSSPAGSKPGTLKKDEIRPPSQETRPPTGERPVHTPGRSGVILGTPDRPATSSNIEPLFFPLSLPPRKSGDQNDLEAPRPWTPGGTLPGAAPGKPPSTPGKPPSTPGGTLQHLREERGMTPKVTPRKGLFGMDKGKATGVVHPDFTGLAEDQQAEAKSKMPALFFSPNARSDMRHLEDETVDMKMVDRFIVEVGMQMHHLCKHGRTHSCTHAPARIITYKHTH